MKQRFSQYLRNKSLSLNKLSEISGVSVSTISRFCRGGVIGSDNLLAILQACDDLSLEWLFFGLGPMYRPSRNSESSVGNHFDKLIGNGSYLSIRNIYEDKNFLAVVAEMDHIISEKDRTIHDRDMTITNLQHMLLEIQKK